MENQKNKLIANIDFECILDAASDALAICNLAEQLVIADPAAHPFVLGRLMRVSHSLSSALSNMASCADIRISDIENEEA